MTRTSVKSILAIGFAFVMSLMSSTASAWVSSTSSTQIACKLPCSIEVDGILKGLGNVTSNPTSFTVSILIQNGEVVFLNPAGNSKQANGVPFVNVPVELTGSNLINAKQVSKNGSTLSAIVFHDSDLITEVINELTILCNGTTSTAPNQTDCDYLAQIQTQQSLHPNWQERIVVTQMQVLGEQITDGTLSDAMISACLAPPTVTADPVSFVTSGFTYQCTELCSDKTGSGYPYCNSLTLPYPYAPQP